jgi:hypothetical protein
MISLTLASGFIPDTASANLLETRLHVPNVLFTGPWLSILYLHHHFLGALELVTLQGLRRRIEISAFTLGDVQHGLSIVMSQ